MVPQADANQALLRGHARLHQPLASLLHERGPSRTQLVPTIQPCAIFLTTCGSTSGRRGLDYEGSQDTYAGTTSSRTVCSPLDRNAPSAIVTMGSFAQSKISHHSISIHPAWCDMLLPGVSDPLAERLEFWADYIDQSFRMDVLTACLSISIFSHSRTPIAICIPQIQLLYLQCQPSMQISQAAAASLHAPIVPGSKSDVTDR